MWLEALRLLSSSTLLQILTAAGTEVKVWDAKSGMLLKRMRNITGAPPPPPPPPAKAKQREAGVVQAR